MFLYLLDLMLFITQSEWIKIGTNGKLDIEYCTILLKDCMVSVDFMYHFEIK